MLYEIYPVFDRTKIQGKTHDVYFLSYPAALSAFIIHLNSPGLSLGSLNTKLVMYWQNVCKVEAVIYIYIYIYIYIDRLCGLVVRVSGYKYRGPGFDSRRYQIF